jgi:hypothetical protein
VNEGRPEAAACLVRRRDVSKWGTRRCGRAMSMMALWVERERRRGSERWTRKGIDVREEREVFQTRIAWSSAAMNEIRQVGARLWFLLLR